MLTGKHDLFAVMFGEMLDCCQVSYPYLDCCQEHLQTRHLVAHQAWLSSLSERLSPKFFGHLTFSDIGQRTLFTDSNNDKIG